MALLSKPCCVLYLLLVAEGNTGQGKRMLGVSVLFPASLRLSGVFRHSERRLPSVSLQVGKNMGWFIYLFLHFPQFSQSVSVATLIGIGLLEKHSFL